MKKIIAFTSSRADYSHLFWPLKRLNGDSTINLKVLAFGPHLSPMYGNTWQQIEEDGFELIQIESLLNSDSDVGMAKSIAIAMLAITELLSTERPDAVIIIADRYEMLAPANVALALRIPIIHIEGGDVSEGAIDDAVRNALTKMSHIHFTPTLKCQQRVLNMGEESWRVHCSGAPSLDHLTQSPDIPDINWINLHFNIPDNDKLLLVAYHSVTLADNPLKEVDALYHALSTRNERIIFCFPNSDMGSQQLIEKCHTFCKQNKNASIVINASAQIYLGLMKRADLMIGNSSSGIMESPSFKLPCIDVGNRQKGREKAANIISCQADKTDLEQAIVHALKPKFRSQLKNLVNPYGNGTASLKMLNVITRLPSQAVLINKKNML
jgi:UDP-N-acetylglucosamine 2-epimerase (non-hydrolysing)/GDP/UDP-N,N'-diacetylbacillosamine 2-epimerase (hydrolysing)